MPFPRQPARKANPEEVVERRLDEEAGEAGDLSISGEQLLLAGFKAEDARRKDDRLIERMRHEHRLEWARFWSVTALMLLALVGLGIDFARDPKHAEELVEKLFPYIGSAMLGGAASRAWPAKRKPQPEEAP